jgi:hypothetical protein
MRDLATSRPQLTVCHIVVKQTAVLLWKRVNAVQRFGT